MDEKELARLIARELGGDKATKRAPDTDRDKGRDKGRDGDRAGRGKPAGFSVDAAALDKYAKETAALADELRTAARAKVGSITGEGFGRIGRDSGFARALVGYADALRKQVAGVADHTADLGKATRKTAEAYQGEDVGIAGDFSKLLG
jgi:hypothetical protein